MDLKLGRVAYIITLHGPNLEEKERKIRKKKEKRKVKGERGGEGEREREKEKKRKEGEGEKQRKLILRDRYLRLITKHNGQRRLGVELILG